MAKGKPTPKITKGAKGRKNHGPKRHLDHDIFPKALRMSMTSCGVLDKYGSYDSFCLAMQARGVRADFRIMWSEFCNCKNKAAQDAFFANAKQIGLDVMKKQKSK